MAGCCIWAVANKFRNGNKVQSIPYAYDQGAEAKPDDIESAPVVWCFPPPLWAAVRGGGIGRGILHLFCGSVKTIEPHQSEERGDLRGHGRAATYMRGYYMHFIFGMGRSHYAGNDSGYLPKPSPVVHGNGPFPVCLFLDLGLMAAIVSGKVGHFKIKIKIKSTQRSSEFHNRKPVVHFTHCSLLPFTSAHTSWTRDLVIITWFDS